MAGLALYLLFAVPATASEVELSCALPQENGIHQCSDGVAELAWIGKNAKSFTLEENLTDEPGGFKIRYQGTDLASVRSGLAPGVHHFRVRADDGPWSDTLTVQVAYMEEARLHLLLALGGIVVLATVIAILHGHLTHSRRGDAP